VQPYAELMVDGHKTIELRKWRPSEERIAPGSPFLVHASKTKASAEDLARLEIDGSKLWYGAFLGIMELVSIKSYSCKAEMLQDSGFHHADKQYFMFDDYVKGHAWGFQVRVIKKFPTPVPGKGALSFFQIKDEDVCAMPPDVREWINERQRLLMNVAFSINNAVVQDSLDKFKRINKSGPDGSA